MLDSFINKTELSIRIRKRNVVSFVAMFVLFLFGFLCCSLCANCVSNYHESIARKMGRNTYVCEVTSSRENETYREFFSYADDLAGAEIKDNVDTFVLCEEKNNIVPTQLFLSPSNIVDINSIFQYTAWRFDLVTYNLKTLTGSPINNLAENEIYISRKLSHILMDRLECDEIELVGMQFDIQTKASLRTMKIVDVIINFDDIDFGPYFPNNTIITNFASTATFFNNSKYVAVLRGNYLSKNYELRYLDSGIRKMKDKGIEYSQNLFRLRNKTLIDDGIQELKVKTNQFYDGNNKKMAFFAIVPIVILTFIGVASFFGLIGKEIYLSLFLAIAFYLVATVKFVPLIVVNDTIILLSNAFASVVLVFFIVPAICVFMLFERNQNIINGKGKRCQIKI